MFFDSFLLFLKSTVDLGTIESFFFFFGSLSIGSSPSSQPAKNAPHSIQKERHFNIKKGREKGGEIPHRAENSSKVSSWCSLRRATEVLKLRLEPAMTPGTKEALARVGATGRFARKKVLEGPARAVIRNSEVEDISVGEIYSFLYIKKKKKNISICFILFC